MTSKPPIVEPERAPLVYPDPLSPEERGEMEGALPDRPEADVLRWIAGEGPDPWRDASSG